MLLLFLRLSLCRLFLACLHGINARGKPGLRRAFVVSVSPRSVAGGLINKDDVGMEALGAPALGDTLL